MNDIAGAIWPLIQDFWTRSLLSLWASLLLIGLVLEVFFRAEKGQPARALWFNIRYGFLYLVLIFLLSPMANILVARALQTVGGGWIDLTGLAGAGILAQIGAGLVTVLIIDFFYYWWHRMQHTIPWLWDQHALHHSDTALNVTTNIRHHWTEFLFQAVVIAIPMGILFKMPTISMWIVSTAIAAWSFFIHLNVRLHMGSLTAVFAGPQLHRVHHSCLPQHTDKNFAAYTPVWDVLFGSYFHPARDEYPPTGLHSGERIDSLSKAMIYPFSAWKGRLSRLRKAELPERPLAGE